MSNMLNEPYNTIYQIQITSFIGIKRSLWIKLVHLELEQGDNKFAL